MNPNVLLIEDHDATRFGFVRYFSREGYEIKEASDLAMAVKAIAADSFDAIILDINLPDGSGIDFIDTIRQNDLSVPVVVITGAGDIPLAVEAMRRGADNFLTKPVDNAALVTYLRKTIEIGGLKRRVPAWKRLKKQEEIFFGETPAMRDVLNLARTAATSGSPVLITGETGTGKGVLARWVHRQSSRASHEFVELNCSGLRGEMLSREIFGNARGAFTSANQDRKGLLDVADKGTLFLDEIGDMGVDIQAQFLKVLEEKSFRRLGDVKLLRSDFRLICATHQDIESLVHSRLFRQDFMYRINLMAIHIPPLRERMEDLPAIVSNLLRELGASEAVVPDDVMGMLMTYAWPGNIRELKNVLERALLIGPRGATLHTMHFSNLGNGLYPLHAQNPRSVQEAEETRIKTALDLMKGDTKKAAKSLNISRATLYRRLKQIKDTAR